MTRPHRPAQRNPDAVASKRPRARVPEAGLRTPHLTMVKIGDEWPPAGFLPIVIGIWVVLQAGVGLTLWWRRRRESLKTTKKDD